MTFSVLGLDISTSCTGYTILDEGGNLLRIGHIKLDNIESFFEKCNVVRSTLADLCKEYNIQQVAIEQNLQAFRPGLSSASTINTLARFNGAISYICFDVFKFEPVFINVIKSRSSLGIKIDYKDKTVTTKDKILIWVQTQIDYNWPKKKTGSLKKECYDMADSYVIARSSLIQ
jgi:hypothetical protein